jgi:hypothetical protein
LSTTQPAVAQVANGIARPRGRGRVSGSAGILDRLFDNVKRITKPVVAVGEHLCASTDGDGEQVFLCRRGTEHVASSTRCKRAAVGCGGSTPSSSTSLRSERAKAAAPKPEGRRRAVGRELLARPAIRGCRSGVVGLRAWLKTRRSPFDPEGRHHWRVVQRQNAALLRRMSLVRIQPRQPRTRRTPSSIGRAPAP